jgi:hypothetical protein
VHTVNWPLQNKSDGRFDDMLFDRGGCANLVGSVAGMPISFKVLTIGCAMSAFALVQTAAPGCAQERGAALAVYSKSPPSNFGDQTATLVAPIPVTGAGGATIPVPRPPSAIPYGDGTVAGTGLAVTRGFSDRAVADIAINWYYSAFGLHLDAAREWREENASLLIGGLSYMIAPYVRSKFLYGTSSANLSIQPETYLRGEIEFQPPPPPGAIGVVATPAVTYRAYRNGVRELVPEMHVAFYHPEFADHTYFVTELKAETIFVESVRTPGYEFSGAATYVVPRLGTAGAELFGGLMVYDATLCVALCTVKNPFVGVRPLLSLYLNRTETLELYVHGEIVTTQSYNIFGGTLGLKVAF